MESIYSDLTVSVTELKRNFAQVLATAKEVPIAVLNHNKPEVYLLSAQHYENILNALEDIEDRKLVEERREGSFIEVDLDEL